MARARPGPPRPDRRRDVIEDRDRRRAGAHPARDAVGEIRTVDDDQRIGRAATTASAVSRMRRKIIGSRRGIALTPDDRQLVDRERADDPRGRHGASADAGELQRAAAAARRARAPARRRAHRRIPPRRRDRSTAAADRRVIHRAASSRTPTKKIFARSAAAMTLAGSAMMVLPAATATPGKPGARDIFDGLRADRRQIEAAVLAGLWRLDQNADAGAAWCTRSCRAQFGDAHQHIVGAFGRFDREHVVVGDDRGLADIERPERGDQFQARGRCRRGRAATAARRPSTPSGTMISGATSSDADDPQAAALRRCRRCPDSSRSSPPRKRRAMRGSSRMRLPVEPNLASAAAAAVCR